MANRKQWRVCITDIRNGWQSASPFSLPMSQADHWAGFMNTFMVHHIAEVEEVVAHNKPSANYAPVQAADEVS